VEDLRTVALAEAGALPLHREPVDLAALVAAVAADFEPAARDAGVRLVVEAAGAADLPPLSADPALLRRVLANLITNALRHTPAGGSVRIAASAPGREPGPAGDRQWLTVTDSGTGIPPELLPRVFDRFAKGAGSTGTGLGLAIARDIIEAHGGTIAAATPPEGGTRIEIALPTGPGRD
jgi:two-component system sensor histidine kinase BaeS